MLLAEQNDVMQTLNTKGFGLLPNSKLVFRILSLADPIVGSDFRHFWFQIARLADV